MTGTVSVHCNGTNDQVYLNIKTLLFLQKSNFKTVAHFYIHSHMRSARVQVRKDLQRPSANNAWQACNRALVYFLRGNGELSRTLLPIVLMGRGHMVNR